MIFLLSYRIIILLPATERNALINLKGGFFTVEIPEKFCYNEIEVDKMLFEGNNPITDIVGVEQLRWGGGTFQVAPREYAGLAFRTKGTTVITVGEVEYYVNPNEVLYMPQNLAYRAKYTDTELLVIHFKTLQDDRSPEVYSVEDVGQLYQAFLRAHALWENKAGGYPMYILSEIYRILGLIGEKESKTNQPSCFLEAICYIHSHFKENNLSVDTICHSAGIGQTSFRLLFQKHYGKTPVEYITDLRLAYARNLIASGATVETAAYESGFNDPKYFARTVKKHLGCTPRQLRLYGK